VFVSSIIVNCADDDVLAGKIRDYLIDKIISAASNDSIYISLSGDEIEIFLEKLGVSKEDIRKLLQEFLKSDPDLANDYSITEFDGLFIVGIPKRLDEMVCNCEMCGYIASSEEDLSIHKRTHGLIFIL
jgi:hypothetical protein